MLLTANQVHDGLSWMPDGTTLHVNDHGVITDILDAPTDDTHFLDGILVPGFINVHCHLELSHMKGEIAPHTGLVNFLKNVSLRRNDFTDEQKHTARHEAFAKLIDGGVVAVGDIANSTDTLDLRAANRLHFHTFVEALGFAEASAARSFGYASQTYQAFHSQEPSELLLNQSITPHAPYSVSRTLFQAIDSFTLRGLISIHNQECDAENEYFRWKTGDMKELFAALGISDEHFEATGHTSLQSYLEWISKEHSFIFVHNTVSSRQDVQYVKTHIRDAMWCLCANANLYIEQKLPDIAMLMEEGCRICIGTDSLASNNQLDILSELTTIKAHHPTLSWEILLRWATHNGAIALRMDERLGMFEKGKQPGVLNIRHLQSGRPTVNRII